MRIGNKLRQLQIIGAPVIEIHTGRYADATNAAQQNHELARIKEAVGICRKP